MVQGVMQWPRKKEKTQAVLAVVGLRTEVEAITLEEEDEVLVFTLEDKGEVKVILKIPSHITLVW